VGLGPQSFAAGEAGVTEDDLWGYILLRQFGLDRAVYGELTGSGDDVAPREPGPGGGKFVSTSYPEHERPGDAVSRSPSRPGVQSDVESPAVSTLPPTPARPSTRRFDLWT